MDEAYIPRIFSRLVEEDLAKAIETGVQIVSKKELRRKFKNMVLHGIPGKAARILRKK